MKLSLYLCWLPLLAACGGPLKYSVASTARAPGADAKVVADISTDQGQTRLDVDVVNLPPPGRVSDKATNYTAWYRKNSDATWSRIGGLKYDNSGREGTITGSVPEIAFDFTVTAEENESPASPSPDVILAQRVGK
jgi:hypothetical protein